MKKVTGHDLSRLYSTTDLDEMRELMGYYCGFWKQLGYDTVTWELGITSIMPGNGALGAHLPGCIKTREDFDKYPWDSLEQRYFDKWSTHYEIL